jgi:hypothetical protein
MKKILFLFLIILFLFGCSTTQKSEADFSIIFVLDKKLDTENIFFMLRPNEPGGLDIRAWYMGIDYDFAKMIQDANNYSEVKNSLENLVNKRYREIGNGLRRSANDYSAAWEPCIQEFSNVVIEITQHNWFYNSYTCVVSAFHYGLSNWYGNKIIRHYGEDPVEQRYVTAWEIVLSHVFHVSRKYFDRIEAPDHIIWAISEITALLILEDNRLLELWEGDSVPFSSIGYNQLKELEIKLRNAYADNTNFKDYLQAAIQLAKETDIGIDFTSPLTASFWLLDSIPEDFSRQPTPTAIGWNIVIDDSLSVDLLEPINYQGGGWWTFSNKEWEGKGEYYILFVPIVGTANGSFAWMFNEARIYVENDSIPIKLEIDSSNISFPLDKFKKLF